MLQCCQTHELLAHVCRRDLTELDSDTEVELITFAERHGCLDPAGEIDMLVLQ